MRLSRRQLLAGGAAAGLAAGGIYELVDQLGGSPSRPAAQGLTPEQHLLQGVRVVEDNGVEVVVPPLHHQLVTARVKVGDSKRELADAQRSLEDVLAKLDAQYEQSPAGLGVTVAWGLPYFRRFVPKLADTHIPVDLRASKSKDKPVRVLLDSRRFPSDPAETILEANDVAVLLRSDHLDHIAAGSKAIFDLGLFERDEHPQGVRGRRLRRRDGLPKQMAVAAQVPGVVPDPRRVGALPRVHVDAKGRPRPAEDREHRGARLLAHGGYFAQGTHLATSHITEDVEAWYVNFPHQERVSTVFRPGLEVEENVLTVPQGPNDVSGRVGAYSATSRQTKQIGHSAALQTVSRLAKTAVGTSGAIYGPGTAIPHRADFNTLDNPFFWSADPTRDGMSTDPAAGVHFVVFNPSSDDFNRGRLAMDGVLPGGTKLPFAPRDRGQGFNSILRTTHRQNFLVPPRRHRSFPLVELL